MKLWYSFVKELKLLSKSFYFYIEIVMAVIMLVVVLFVIPENFEHKSTEYLYIDMPDSTKSVFVESLLKADTDGYADSVEIKVKKEMIPATYYESAGKKIYLVENKDSLIKLSEAKKKLGIVIELDDSGSFHYIYYMQGYESQRLKNLYLVIHNEDGAMLQAGLDSQDVRPISEDYDTLNDRENVIPAMLTFNGSFMGMFIIAAFIFLDKGQGIIKAYAVTASSVWQYLMSKALVVTFTAIITSIIITVPVMGLRPNYLLLILFLTTTGFFASSLGLLISSFYRSMNQAFNMLYVLIVLLMIPSIAYFIPSWEPGWIKFIPSYQMLHGFKEIIIGNGDAAFVVFASVGFLMAGIVLFLWANRQHKKALTA